MKYIKLTQGKVAVVDDKNYEELNQYKWQATKQKGGTFYATRAVRVGVGSHIRVHMHRQIMELTDRLEVDHIDHDGLNNLEVNLRVCSHEENMRNKRIACNNTSGYKGVHFRNDCGKWKAQITVNKKRKSLGSFKCKHDAGVAYNEAAIKYYGDFAALNVIVR